MLKSLGFLRKPPRVEKVTSGGRSNVLWALGFKPPRGEKISNLTLVKLKFLHDQKQKKANEQGGIKTSVSISRDITVL